MSMQPTYKRDDNWSRLLTRVGRDRDRGAFEALFDHFAPLIKGFCLSESGVHSAEAEQLLQDTMLNIWQKSPFYDPHRMPASTWIFTVLRNCRIDLSRRKGDTAPLADLDVDDIWDDTTELQPFVVLRQRHDCDDVHDRLHNLPIEQFHVVRKVYEERRSHSKISEDLGLTVGAVQSRLRLALRKLGSNASGP